MRFIKLAAVAVLALPLQIAFAHAQTALQTPDGARQGNDIGTRDSLPLSNSASNINSADTASTIAPTPPLPDVPPGATAGQYLQAAQQALASNQTGMTQDALERAETRILDRAVPQAYGNSPDQDPVVAQISIALNDLGTGQKDAALQVINQTLASNAPELTD